jgi:hypothetical protein
LDKTPGLRGSQRVKEKMTTLLKVGYEALWYKEKWSCLQ